MVILQNKKKFDLFWVPAKGSGSSVTPHASQSHTGMQLQGPHTLTSPCQSLHSWPVCWTAMEFRQRSKDMQRDMSDLLYCTRFI